MKGKLFVIEGLDGSGKQTQSNLLYDKLSNEGYKIKKVEFPNYKSPSSSLVKMYLNGDFGKKANDISPYIASTFYAADRYATYKTEIEEYYLDDYIILADRYTSSNMVHQASKLNNKQEIDKYLEWLCGLEFNIYQIPIPDQVFFLDVNANQAHDLIEGRINKYTNIFEKDIHENDINYQIDSYNTALYLIKKYNWVRINCLNNMNLLSVDSINKLLYNEIIKYL